MSSPTSSFGVALSSSGLTSPSPLISSTAGSVPLIVASPSAASWRILRSIPLRVSRRRTPSCTASRPCARRAASWAVVSRLSWYFWMATDLVTSIFGAAAAATSPAAVASAAGASWATAAGRPGPAASHPPARAAADSRATARRRRGGGAVVHGPEVSGTRSGRRNQYWQGRTSVAAAVTIAGTRSASTAPFDVRARRNTNPTNRHESARRNRRGRNHRAQRPARAS